MGYKPSKALAIVGLIIASSFTWAALHIALTHDGSAVTEGVSTTTTIILNWSFVIFSLTFVVLSGVMLRSSLRETRYIVMSADTLTIPLGHLRERILTIKISDIQSVEVTQMRQGTLMFIRYVDKSVAIVKHNFTQQGQFSILQDTLNERITERVC